MAKQLFETVQLDENQKYNKKIVAPQYVPSRVRPSLLELCNTSDYGTLVRDIKASNVSPEEKEFLLKAATRHIVFNYAKIADYYAHATPEMQRLMEQSALVIIDIDDAIANGYVRLSTTIEKLIEESKDGKK